MAVYPPRPAAFTADAAPIGVEYKHVTFTRPRMKVKPRLQLVHTNAASGIGTLASAWNWSHAKPGSNTIPHYQIDREGRARKMLRSDEVGIANATVDSAQGGRGDVRDWSLAYETSDDGYGPGRLGDASGFTAGQAETLAQILAYESIVSDIPLEYPTEWFGAGTACHTEPFEYPYWTMYRGKTCPGWLKKQHLRENILPRARAIRDTWLGSVPPIEPPDLGSAMHDFYLYLGDGHPLYAVHVAAGYKTWVPSLEALRFRMDRDHAAGRDSANQIVPVSKDDLESYGPILGTLPPGSNGYS